MREILKIPHLGLKIIHQPRLTGSKLETPITAPRIAVTTTPPETMLSKKFLREGETVAASATSGEIIEAVNAAAVSPVTIFSFKDAFTTNLALRFVAATDFDGFRVNGAFKNA